MAVFFKNNTECSNKSALVKNSSNVRGGTRKVKDIFLLK